MDWLQGMNNVVTYVEENLTEPIRQETLASMVGCSVYEFSRIFSFLAGMSVSEYIRRRRLSQAVFDLQNGSEKIVDIALKYCYESPTTFTRAFRELHGTTPSCARKDSIRLKTYPPITFLLTIKGVTAMEFRIEKKERQVGAYWFQSRDGKTKTVIGAQYRGNAPENMTVETIPAATWAVFSIGSSTGIDHVPAAYARIMTEWFPTSGYRRDESVPNLEVYPPGNAGSADYVWEIWIPVLPGK